MGKERMKMQENMNPAPEGAQTPADEEAAREAARLSQLKADMLVLIDTVATPRLYRSAASPAKAPGHSEKKPQTMHRSTRLAITKESSM